jgi:glycosyltransferase involved in cell wall biosynthesis
MRPQVRGKFIWVGDEKLYVRGVTYGTFRPDESGNQYHDQEKIDRDFALMAANGFNAVRVYNTPPISLLNTAHRFGLRVMLDLAADQYVGFLTDKKGAPDIAEILRAKVRDCSRHPAILAYSLGNEIPAPIVRWHGRRRIERYLEKLYRAVKAEDPGVPVTYVNYPSTEYLQLPFLDFFCFNVYLESQDRFAAYLSRLQNIVGDAPLLMGEIGLDSYRNGQETQARVLDWEVRTAFQGGCAGVFVYSWTDEWFRGGAEAEDWAFGLTGRDRSPKPALAAVRDAFRSTPFAQETGWPFISVVVCTYNGARTIRECCEGLRKLEYPNFEVIVVNDGSTDGSAAIAREFGFRVIGTPNRGLSSARNTGFEAAKGEIVAYLDDDAYPDPQWLSYLASTFMSTDYAAVGGPNIAPPDDELLAACIARAPGGPVHVLLSDCEAEHIPGCNMAFRRSDLAAIGGFDPQFRVAGDDVDVCWRLKQTGRKLGFSPAAMVWHHRRGSVRTYWKQQRGYGKAEALLETKWPDKYNTAGHVSWAGRVYGNGSGRSWWRRARIYQGVWGSAPFQSIYQPAHSTFSALPLMPEWYLLVPGLAALAAVGELWRPLLLALPLLAVAAGIPVFQSCRNAAQTRVAEVSRSGLARMGIRCLIAFLYLLQPAARLHGRLCCGLTLWRRRGPFVLAFPCPRTFRIWSEQWRAASDRLQSMESKLRAEGACVVPGGEFDGWDLEVRPNMLGAARLRMAVEEHGLGRQLVRFRVWPKPSTVAIVLGLLLSSLAAAAALDGAWPGAVILASTAVAVAARVVQECGGATGALLMPVLMEERASKLAVVPKRENAAMAAAAHSRTEVHSTTVLECEPAPAETAVGRKAG